MMRWFAIFLFTTATALAQYSGEEAFYAGNAAFKEGEFEEAVASYTRALEAGHDGAALRFNLGNAYLFSGRHGPALYHYRVAETLAPRDEDIRKNIAVARSRASDKLSRSEAPGFLRALSWIHRRMTRSEAFLLFALLWGSGAALLHVQQIREVRWFGRLGVLLLVLGLVPGSAVATDIFDGDQATEGVILPEEVDVFTGPSDTTYAVYFKLHAGAEVTVEQVLDGWVKIAVDNDRKGYVPAPQIGLIP